MKEREIVEKALAGMPYNECMRMVDDGALSVVSEFKGTMIGEIVVATRPTNLRVHRRDRHIFEVENRPKPLHFKYIYNPEFIEGRMLMTFYHVGES